MPPGVRAWRCAASTPSSRHKPAPLLLDARPGLPALLLRLVGRRVDRRFYFGQRGRRAVCACVLHSFSGKWGSFTQQRPLVALSSVRRLQVQCDRAAPERAGLCATRTQRIRLLCSSSSMRSLARSRSLSMISLRPPTRRRRFLFSRSSSIRH